MSTIKHYTINEACELLSIGRTKMYDLINRNMIISILIGRSRRIPHAELERYCSSQAAGV